MFFRNKNKFDLFYAYVSLAAKVTDVDVIRIIAQIQLIPRYDFLEIGKFTVLYIKAFAYCLVVNIDTKDSLIRFLFQLKIYLKKHVRRGIKLDDHLG